MITNIYKLNYEYRRLCNVAIAIVEAYEGKQNQDTYYGNMSKVFLRTILIDVDDILSDVMFRFERDIFWYNESVKNIERKLADKDLIPPYIPR